MSTAGDHDAPDIELRDNRLSRGPVSEASSDAPRTPDQQKQEAELANRLSQLIEETNERVVPLVKMMRQHVDNMFARPEDERDEDELIGAVKPLLTQAEKTLQQTQGAIKGADPENKVSSRAKRHAQDHKATPEEQRLSEALKVLVEEVAGGIEYVKGKLDSFPRAKRDLGPLLDALGQPITQIVGGVGLLLAGVLNLLGNLLSGLGLDSLFRGILGATGLTAIYKGLGLDKWMKY
ncbi:hypothetical protein BDY19DRAFT_919173 [Irpex rosettiformis]|uniref:Uncharacterized protein n=1 Tax=Irpex rosettiformis TaxID=378272 RepID=A0ACB8UHL3_9APHY|nr:hypothetical protein BDY19DRAFT_919173 [Irpex rosettiformis]